MMDDGRVLARLRGVDANCVDLGPGARIVIAGWRDGEVRVWSLEDDTEVVGTSWGRDSVLCCAWDSCGDAAAIGSAALTTTCVPRPLYVWDTVRDRVTWRCGERRRGAGVLACQWLGRNVLLAAGYDCAARVWDARCGGAQDRAVATWVEPHGDPVYSLAWDGRHAVIGGAARHGRCTLWDLRRPRRYVQMYHTHVPRRDGMSRSSPVYAVQIDAGELWTALDTCLAVLDFTTPQDTPARYYDLPFLQVA